MLLVTYIVCGMLQMDLIAFPVKGNMELKVEL